MILGPFSFFFFFDLTPFFESSMSNVNLAKKLYCEGSFSKAFEIYEAEAKLGNANCQCQLGFMYYQGKGTRRDFGLAERWFRQALERGDEQASVGLFRVYVEREKYGIALGYMRQMARKGYPPALYWLGRMYYNGWGVEKDMGRALIFFSLAARYGHFVGMRDRAKLLMRGVNGFFARFLGIYELVRLSFTMAVVLRRDFNDERQFH